MPDTPKCTCRGDGAVAPAEHVRRAGERAGRAGWEGLATAGLAREHFEVRWRVCRLLRGVVAACCVLGLCEGLCEGFTHTTPVYGCTCHDHGYKTAGSKIFLITDQLVYLKDSLQKINILP